MMMITTRRMMLLGLAAMTFAAVAGAGFVSANADRADCPGKIVCPRTGELICRDRCPVRDAARPDCPGRIVCPVTGELVCKDRCPVGGKDAACTTTGSRPSCCQAGTS